MNETTVTAIIGFLALALQAYFKDRADERRARLLADGLEETAAVAVRKEEKLARVTEQQTALLVEKIDENTNVSKSAFHVANQAKDAISEVAQHSASGLDRVAAGISSDQCQAVLQQLVKELGELKVLVTSQNKIVP